MNKFNAFDVVSITMLCFIVMFLSWVGFIAVPTSLANERTFVEKCTRLGGVPSKYETMIGKTNYSERLCIKSENIVTIEMR